MEKKDEGYFLFYGLFFLSRYHVFLLIFLQRLTVLIQIFYISILNAQSVKTLKNNNGRSYDGCVEFHIR